MAACFCLFESTTWCFYVFAWISNAFSPSYFTEIFRRTQNARGWKMVSLDRPYPFELRKFRPVRIVTCKSFFSYWWLGCCICSISFLISLSSHFKWRRSARLHSHWVTFLPFNTFTFEIVFPLCLRSARMGASRKKTGRILRAIEAQEPYWAPSTRSQFHGETAKVLYVIAPPLDPLANDC